jgi:hypothetical protein
VFAGFARLVAKTKIHGTGGWGNPIIKIKRKFVYKNSW